MKKINKKNKLIGAALVIAAIAFAGTASTATLTVPAGVGATLGYDTTTVSGGTVKSMHYNLSSATQPDTISSVEVKILDPNIGLIVGDVYIVPQLSIRLETNPVSNTTQSSCGTATVDGSVVAVAGLITVVATAADTQTFTCTAPNGTAGGTPVNALTLRDNYLTIQNV